MYIRAGCLLLSNKIIKTTNKSKLYEKQNETCQIKEIV
jgi:hypothetical protein